jgi:hypothetical protein
MLAGMICGLAPWICLPQVTAQISQTAQTWLKPLVVQTGANLTLEDRTTIKFDIAIQYPPTLSQAKLPSGSRWERSSSLTQALLFSKAENNPEPQLKVTILSSQSTESPSPATDTNAAKSSSPFGSETESGSPNRVFDIDCAAVTVDPKPSDTNDLRFRRMDCSLFRTTTELADFLNSFAPNSEKSMPEAIAQRLLPTEVIALGVDTWQVMLVRQDASNATFSLSGNVKQADPKSFSNFKGTLTVNSDATTSSVDLRSSSKSSEALPDSSVIQSAGSMSIVASRTLSVK